MIYLVFLFGVFTGSFLNVVIYRLKSGEPIGLSRSFCPKCRTQLKWYDLVPILSFIYLRGYCRYCRKKISWQYPIVEILSGFIWVLVFWKVYSLNSLNFFYYIFILSSLLIIAVYDFKWRIIPDKIVYSTVALTSAYNIFLFVRFWDWQLYFLWPLITALVIFTFFFLIFYLSKGRAMGLGDAKLGFLIGLFLGPVSATAALMLAFIIGAICGIILLAIGKKTLKSQIAFGPFLVFGTVAIFFLSNFIIEFFQP